MTIDGKRILLAYLDEAGNTDFGANGSKCFFYTALATDGDGFALHRTLLECRYFVITAYGRFSNSHKGNDYFHATEDSLETRAMVFPVLKEHANETRVYSYIVKKGTLPEDMHTQQGLFEHSATTLLNHLIKTEDVRKRYDHVCVMLDQIPVQKKRRAIVGSLKRTLNALLRETGITFTVMPMASKSDLALQAADYYSWALYRKWEAGDPEQLERLGNNIEIIGQPETEAE